jgi:hypothetical protein
MPKARKYQISLDATAFYQCSKDVPEKLSFAVPIR